MFRYVIALCFATMAAVAPLAAHAADAQVERGKYLVAIAGCSDCHTAGSFLGHPDVAHFLGGSDVGFAVPGLGVFVGPNLTPDKATGIGAWTMAELVAAFTTGKRPDGRMLAPVMPWRDFANLSHADAQAIAAYLKSLPPVSNKVPGPFGPNDAPTVLVFSIQPGPVYAGLPKPPQ
jgi:mono/diheme cytochrome c family protein